MMRDPSTGSGQSANGLQYFLTDHLGSTVAITDSNGTLTSQQRYLPFGGTRANVTIAYPLGTPNSPGTDFGYTGQRQLDAGMGGLMDYKARFYSPYINRFIQPDSIIPGSTNPQAFNRYSYVFGNPIKYKDPSGHGVDCGIGMGCVKDYSGAKTLKDFKGMGWNERKHWLADTVHENKLSHWFDDMLGAIDFMKHNPSLSKVGGTADVMDAAVLQAINDGLLISKHKDAFGSGGQGWADFFTEREQAGDQNHLIATRLSAEQQGVDYSWDLKGTQSAYKNSSLSNQVFFSLFKAGADGYRSSAKAFRSQNPALITAVDIQSAAVTTMTDPRTSGPSLVGIGEVTWFYYEHTLGVLLP